MKLEAASRDHFLTRLNALTPQSERQFGSLTITGMLRHLRRTFEMTLEEIEVPDNGNLLTKTVGKWATIYLPIPIPPGKIKMPDIFTPEPDFDFEGEHEALIAKLDQYLEVLEKDPNRTGLSILFGHMTMTEWSRLHGAHWDHHLKQFGV